MTPRSRNRRRTRRPRQERERDILAAARGVFAERGYSATSVAEIGKLAGVSEATVYNYFETKRQLLMRVLCDFYEPLIAEAEAGLRAIRGAENRLRFLITRHLEAFAADLGLCRLVIREIRPDSELYAEAVHELNRRYTAPALRALEEGIERGELLPEVVPALIRDLIYGGIEHAVWGYVFTGADLDVDRIARQLADAVLAGIVKRDQPAEGTVARLERLVERLETREAS